MLISRHLPIPFHVYLQPVVQHARQPYKFSTNMAEKAIALNGSREYVICALYIKYLGLNNGSDYNSALTITRTR